MLRPTGGWGYHSDTEILFPMRVAHSLRVLRGEAWRNLVDQIDCVPDGHPEQVAFSLTMVRLSGCLTCHTDCYRAMRGCTHCASQAVKRFRGSDEDLLSLFQESVAQVDLFLESCERALQFPASNERDEAHG